VLAAGIEVEANPAELVERHNSDTTQHPPCSRLPPANGRILPKITFAGDYSSLSVHRAVIRATSAMPPTTRQFD
jgi:hypothetical protein